MFFLIDALNEEPPSLQVFSKQKQLKIHSPQHSQFKDINRNSSTKNSKKQSPFVSRPQQAQNSTFEPINQATIQSNEMSEQNSLRKIKKYSKILQNSTHLHQIHHTTPSTVLQLHTSQQLSQKLIRKERLTFQIQNAYNHYTLKNQRKSRVLAKAKELGKNHLYRFLKETSIIGSNKHIHRLYSHSKNLDKIHSSPLKTQQISPDEKTLFIVSLEPNKNEAPIELKKKNLGLPKLLERQTIRQKVTLKTQKPIDPNLCLTTEGSSLSLKKSKSNKKQLIRNITEINEKIRKNRKPNHEKQKLLFPTQKLSMRNQETFLSKWKYKSLFDTEDNATVVRKSANEKKNLGTRMKTFTVHENNRMSNLSVLMEDGQFQNKVKFLKITRSNLMKKEITELSHSGQISLKSLKNGTQQS